MKAIRTQVDEQGDEFSRRTRKSFIGTDHAARQEFKDEQDVNKILARYGVTSSHAVRGPQLGEVDYSTDLQQSLHLIRETRQAFNRLAPELRAKYKNWQGLLDAIQRGELTTLAEEAQPDGNAGTEAANQ